MDQLSPERIYINYPDINDTIRKHIARYRFVQQFVSGTVLDCACGSGYGAAILSERCREVVGVDKSDEAIGFATKQNSRPNVNYLVNDISALSFPRDYFDGIVSLETLEHIRPDEVLGFLGKVDKFLKPGGVFACSSPMLRFRNGKPYITSPYHINEMPKEEFLRLIEDNFSGYRKYFFHQEDGYFLPLSDENTGFCIVVMRKP